METIRVLNLLNGKASAELQQGLLEEARDTALHAVNHYLLTFSIVSEEQSQLDKLALQCQAQISAVILQSIGDQYLNLGMERVDEYLIETGEDMVSRSKNILRLCRTIPCHTSSRKLQSIISQS